VVRRAWARAGSDLHPGDLARRHANFMSALALAAGALERIATEIRHLQRSEVGEAFEPFGKEQKGARRCRTSAIR